MVLWLGEEGVMCNLYRNVSDVFRGMTSSIGGGGGKSQIEVGGRWRRSHLKTIII